MMVRVSNPVVPRAVLGIVNTLLFFPSGAMYPISSFPPWLRAVAAVNPFAYAVRGFRAVLLKNTEVTALAGDVVFLAAFSFICVTGTVLFFSRRL
jgi:ABC-2 type transport system permease protein